MGLATSAEAEAEAEARAAEAKASDEVRRELEGGEVVREVRAREEAKRRCGAGRGKAQQQARTTRARMRVRNATETSEAVAMAIGGVRLAVETGAEVPPRFADLDVVEITAEVLAAGPTALPVQPRAASRGAAEFLVGSLDELRCICDTLGVRPPHDDAADAEDEPGSARPTPHPAQQKQQEECPICMDRPVDVVLACSHGFCKPCEIEWLVGENRGTCPICRSAQTDANDWVLNEEVDTSAAGVASLVARADALVECVHTLLLSLPLMRRVTTPITTTTARRSHSRQEQERREDAFSAWLRGEMRVNDAWRTASARELDKPDECLVRCPRCTTAVSLPANAFETLHSATRMACRACGGEHPLLALDPVTEAPFFHSATLRVRRPPAGASATTTTTASDDREWIP